HGALGGELAEGDLQPAAVAGKVPDADQLEVEQHAQADAGAAQHGQPGAGERVGQLADGRDQVPVSVRRQGAGRRPVQPGDVTGNSSRRGGRSAQPHSARSSKKQRRSMTVRLLTTAETGWSRATRPRQGRLWLWARNPSVCSRVSWVRLRTSGWAAA